jgi:hypothetical protein
MGKKVYEIVQHKLFAVWLCGTAGLKLNFRCAAQLCGYVQHNIRGIFFPKEYYL